MKRYRQNEFPGLIATLTVLLEPNTYVEVGVQRAYTFNQIAPWVKRAVAVDINPMPSVMQRENVEEYVMPSLEFAKVWKDPIDFLLIDADHQKDAVLADFDALSPFVRPGTGMIFLHDTHPVTPELIAPGYCHSAWEAANEIRWSDRYRIDFEIVTIPGPWAGLSIIRKSRSQLSWSVQK
jgi:predicted O-methyltransferase YrrM